MKRVARTKDGLPILRFENSVAWLHWLARNGSTSQGIWLCIAKKESGEKSVNYDEALDAALCYGWIDGQKGAYDGGWWVQRFTPRGERSIWSKRNRARAEALIQSGKMRAAGLKAVMTAKKSREWDRAYSPQRTMDVPPDLRSAFEEHPGVEKFFKSLNSVNRFAILFRIHSAKKAETRRQRIEKFVAMLKKGETIYPQTRKQR